MKYNVGDRVRIKSLDWYNKNKNETNCVDLVVNFTGTMAAFCGKVMTITDIRYNCYCMLEDSGMYYWIDDMIEGPVEEGDKETSWKPSKEEMDVLYSLAYITNKYDEHKEEVITRLYQDLKREFFNGSSYENILPDTEDDIRRRSTIQVLEYARSLDSYNQYGKADIDKNIAWLEKQGKSTSEARVDNELTGKEPTDCEKCGLIRNSFRCLFIDICPHNKQKNIIEIPEDCVIKDENDNIINTSKIVLEKKKGVYPKSLAECLEVLGYEEDALLSNQSLYSYNVNLLADFQKLIICRDAYWKIAGKEMKLGESWTPDYSEKSYEQGSPVKYVIYYTGTHIAKERKCTPSFILTFPTEEMRDVFYENFKDLIESCKELYCY